MSLGGPRKYGLLQSMGSHRAHEKSLEKSPKITKKIVKKYLLN
jgi:hypothetical protein